MTRLARLLTILNLLDKNRSCTKRFLMDRIEMNEREERKFYRDLEDLKDAGFLIVHDRSPNETRYSFTKGFRLGKSILDLDESMAFVVAKSLLRTLGGVFDGAFESLERKVLDAAELRNGCLPSSAFVIPNNRYKDSRLPAMIKDFSDACIKHRVISLSYCGMHDQEDVPQEVEPYYLFFTPEGFWHLRACCLLREDWSVFDLGRVREWKLLDRYFYPRLLGDGLAREISEGFGGYFDEEPTEVIVRFAPQIRPEIQQRVWHSSQRERGLDDGWLEVSFRTTGLEGVAKWLCRWLPHVQVVRPDALRERMIRDLEEQRERLVSFSNGNLQSIE